MKFGTAGILNLVLLVLINRCFCHREFVAEEDDDDDADFCPALATSKDCDDKRSDLQIPASWVTYLHKYEEAKLKSAKVCKGDRLVENVSLLCQFAATIEEDLKIFPKIRLVGDFEAFFPSNPIVLLYGFQHLLSFKTEVGSAQEFLCFQLDGGSTRGVALNFTFWYLLGTSMGTRLRPCMFNTRCKF